MQSLGKRGVSSWKLTSRWKNFKRVIHYGPLLPKSDLVAKAYKRLKKLFLKDAMKEKHLKFAVEYKDLTSEDWQHVVWSDKSVLQLLLSAHHHCHPCKSTVWKDLGKKNTLSLPSPQSSTHGESWGEGCSLIGLSQGFMWSLQSSSWIQFIIWTYLPKHCFLPQEDQFWFRAWLDKGQRPSSCMTMTLVMPPWPPLPGVRWTFQHSGGKINCQATDLSIENPW